MISKLINIVTSQELSCTKRRDNTQELSLLFNVG